MESISPKQLTISLACLVAAALCFYNAFEGIVAGAVVGSYWLNADQTLITGADARTVGWRWLGGAIIFLGITALNFWLAIRD